jgi:signal peptidase I
VIPSSRPVAAAAGLRPRRGRIVGRRGRYAIRWIAIAALVLAGYLTLAPRALGGPASYVIAEGTSMVPTLHTGDLVIMHRADAYAPGDLVAYHSSSLDRVVIHRIVGVDGDRFLLKGDANDWVDPDHPTEEDILGKSWFTVGGAGRFFGWLQQPWLAALAAAVVAYLFWGGGRDPLDRPDPVDDETSVPAP